MASSAATFRTEIDGPAADPLADWSLPGWLYHDPEYFAVEMERVIRPSWQIVCHVNEIGRAHV